MTAPTLSSTKKHCAVALMLVALLVASCAIPAAAQTTSTTTTTTLCQASYCTMCSIGLPNVCIVCNTGYTLMNSGLCKPTGTCSVAQCQQCYGDDDTFCQICQSGYRNTVSGQCTRGRNGAVHTHLTAAVAIVVAAAMYAATML